MSRVPTGRRFTDGPLIKIVLAAALAGLWPAPALAASPPCDPATTARVTANPYDGYARSATTLVATHPVSVSFEFSSTNVDEQTVRVTAPPTVTVRGRATDRSKTIISPRAGPVLLTVNWEESRFDPDFHTCSATATVTLTFSAPKPLRFTVSPPDGQFATYYTLDLFASGVSDMSPVTTRWRARRGTTRFPSSRTRFAGGVIDPQRSRELPFRLGRSAGLNATGEVFPFAFRGAGGLSDVARFTLGRFTRYSTGTFKGNGSFEVQLLQSGHRLLRVRGRLTRCHGRSGCRLATKVESATRPLRRR